MNYENKKIIKDFLDSTPVWLESLKSFSDDTCPLCGINAYKISALSEAIKELYLGKFK